MTTSTLLAPPAGVDSLAMDESTPTCDKRFAALGIPQDEPTRRTCRELILTSPNLGECISGVILYDESIRQRTIDGVSFLTVLADAGIAAGNKVDLGAKPLAGHPEEKVTEGLDGPRDRLSGFTRMGARYAKWRAGFTIGELTPTRACVEANAHALAPYAALCRQVGLVPIVEPEVLMVGEHTLTRSAEVTEDVLHEVFDQLRTQGVVHEAMLVKPNMVLPGLDCPTQDSDKAVAAAIQQPALSIWGGQDANADCAQQALLQRATANRDAHRDVLPNSAPPEMASLSPTVGTRS